MPLPNNILLVTFGSRGDINPFLALGRALKKRGHTVIFITWPLYQEIILAEGLNFIPTMGPLYDELMKIGESADWYHPRKGMQLIAKYLYLGTMQPVYDIIAKFDPKNTIIVSHTIVLGARIAAEKLNMPLVSICLQPSALWSLQSPAEVSTLFSLKKLPFFLRKFIMNTVDRWYLDPLFSSKVNRFRAELGLARVKNIFTHWSLSPECLIGLFPDWFGSAVDWPPQTKLVGFTRYDELVNQSLSIEVQNFLAKGAAPIAFTYGSMMTQGHQFFATSLEAIKKLGHRAIFLTQFPGQIPDYSKDQILILPYTPFNNSCYALPID